MVPLLELKRLAEQQPDYIWSVLFGALRQWWQNWQQSDYLWAVLGIVLSILGLYMLSKALSSGERREGVPEAEWEDSQRPSRAVPPERDRPRTYCPFCDEPISVNAIRCPWCRSDLKGGPQGGDTVVLEEENAPRVALDPNLLESILAVLKEKRPGRRPWVKLTLACLAAAVWLMLLAVALTFAKEKTLGVRVLVWVGLLAGMLAAAYAYILGYERGLCKAWESGAVPTNADSAAPNAHEAPAPEPEPAVPKSRLVGVGLWERVTGSPWAWAVLVGLSLLTLLAALTFHAALKAARGV